MLLPLLIFIQLLFSTIQCQKPSPCPGIFTYEPKGQEEDRWYGVVALQTREDLDGIWLRVELDRPAELLGNWFGETTSNDNKDYVIKNPKYRLEAGPPVSIRFFVKYNLASIIPSINRIKLNGKTICAVGTNNEGATTPQLHISQVQSNRPGEGFLSNREPVNGGNLQKPHRRRTTTTPLPPDDRKPQISGLSPPSSPDFFPGDFAVTRPGDSRPAHRPSIPSNSNIRCGTVAMRASPLLSFGQNTTKGQWPWHAALYYTQGAQFLYTCGATLISEQYALTAAHCVTKPQTNKAVDSNKVTVFLGKHSLHKFGEGSQDREVSKIVIHPQYNYTVFFNDIAVIKLESPIDFTNYVRPCCLWEENTDLELIENKIGTVVGWGFDENRQISETLMQAQMPVVSTVDCIYSNREFFSQFTFDKNFCAGFRNGTTVCNGDSGGGMVFPKTSNDGKTIWQLRGIVSVGVALQGQGICDPNHYVVFTDVAKHLEWIKEVLKE